MYRLLLAFSFVAICLAPVLADTPPRASESDEKIEAKLEVLGKSIEKERAALVSVRKERKKLETELAEVDSQLLKANKKRSELLSRIERLNTAVSELETKAEQTKKRISQLRSLFRKRVVGVYKMRRQNSSFDFLFGSNSATDLLKRAFYLRVIAKADRELIGVLDNTVATLQESANELQESKLSRTKSLKELQVAMLSLQKDKDRRESVIKKKIEKERRIRRSLASLKRNANTLQKMVNVLIVQGERKVVEAVKEKRVEPVKFSGRGLAKSKGKLRFPVSGQLVQGFGKRKHDEFSDILFSKGMEVSADPNTFVKAVASGKVILNRVLPGYGKVMILDHGRRYYSLYGRLNNTKQGIGELANKEDELASLKRTSEEESNFYFELRYKGKAVDPKPYFAALPR
jgi:septal ring factor EnvC (AmiA/AmiB activator)